MRLRLETAKKLRALGAKRKAAKGKTDDNKVTVTDSTVPTKEPTTDSTTTAIKTRAPKVKEAVLAAPSLPKAKFRKRQVHKSWLPTHMFHTKRAHMTPPSQPLWRFAIPLTPTAKSYRPTHRASSERGAVAWDISYVSTVSLSGREDSLIGALRALGVSDDMLSGCKGERWRNGSRLHECMLHEREPPLHPIAPVTIIWCALSPPDVAQNQAAEPDKRHRQLFLRVHPSAFFQLWEELLRLSKIAKPQVSVEDLRFEVGSIEITGPGSTEALLGALWPSPVAPPTRTGTEGSADDEECSGGSSDIVWKQLAGLTTPSMLPEGAVLSFNVQDPRLHHPPRTIELPKTAEQQTKLLELLASWPPEKGKEQKPAGFFNRKLRRAAEINLPSQKAINRRKTLASPGQYPDPSPKDPTIPVLLYATRPPQNAKGKQGTWTLLLPWKTVQSVWYGLMYYPLSTGQQVRFGGLNEKRQLAFERGDAWFPGDFPGTKAGWDWEVVERKKRWEEWHKRPKSKRTSWEAVDLGGGKKGEVGEGWSCDWQRLIAGPPNPGDEEVTAGAEKEGEKQTEDGSAPAKASKPTAAASPPPPMPAGLTHIPSAQANALLRLPDDILPNDLIAGLITVRLTLITRGVPITCARIYRLPSSATNVELRKQWLALHPRNQPKKAGPKHSLPRLPRHAPAHEVQRRLAQSLLEPPRVGDAAYPACPGEDDLIGFVTTGNFNLGEGQGTGIGSILLSKLVEEVRRHDEEDRLCIVRNAGNGVGRLARWDTV